MTPGEFTQFLLKAAERGDAEAQCIIGGCYKYGDGVEENATEAARWFRIAAEKGNALAKRNLGFCYARGEGVEMDFAEAEKWYRMAAEQGDADAQAVLNECHVVCEGMEMTLSEAAECTRLKAEAEHARAEWDLSLYADTSKTHQAGALSPLRKAAYRGHPKAEYILASCYELGNGVEKNLAEAIRWY